MLPGRVKLHRALESASRRARASSARGVRRACKRCHKSRSASDSPHRFGRSVSCDRGLKLERIDRRGAVVVGDATLVARLPLGRDAQGARASRVAGRCAPSEVRDADATQLWSQATLLADTRSAARFGLVAHDPRVERGSRSSGVVALDRRVCRVTRGDALDSAMTSAVLCVFGARSLE